MQLLEELKYKFKDITKLNKSDTLLIAIGNSARSDDGLGWAFLDKLESADCFNGKTMSCYQLQIEDAEVISHYPRVIFVDAFENPSESEYEWEVTKPLNDFTFTTHALTPSAVLFLCNDLYNSFPEAYTLKIRGYHWALEVGLSSVAEKNLYKALNFFIEKLN